MVRRHRPGGGRCAQMRAGILGRAGGEVLAAVGRGATVVSTAVGARSDGLLPQPCSAHPTLADLGHGGSLSPVLRPVGVLVAGW